MHNNYHFFVYLTSSLRSRILGYNLVECFSQQKEELILIFENHKGENFIIQGHLTSSFTCLYFPESFNRAKKNSVNLFPELIGAQVIEVVQIENDRSFILSFSGGFKLLFKMHGNRSNLILFQNEGLLKVFKNKLKKDHTIVLSELDKTVDHSFVSYNLQGFRKTFFTLGTTVSKVLIARGMEKGDLLGSFVLVMELLTEFEKGEFYVSWLDGEVVLLLMEAGEVIEKFQEPIAAINFFYQTYYRFGYLEKLKSELKVRVNTLLKKANDYLNTCQKRLNQLENEQGPEKLADVIMANLHQLDSGTEKATLFDFYSDKEIEITIPGNQTPQKYAELLYKKAKKRPLEKSKLLELSENRMKALEEYYSDLELIENSQTHKDLLALIKKYEVKSSDKQKETSEKFKSMEFMGYKILIGRNAANNDLLTMKFAHKNDLWLHARDVSGSHVVIRHKAGQNVPRPVIERAAALAAYYSERKNDSLCPVMVTEKKYVRKVKGAPKGAVKVEKEKVLLVEPNGL